MFNSAEGMKAFGIISPCSAPKEREDQEIERAVDRSRVRKEVEAEEGEEEEAY